MKPILMTTLLLAACNAPIYENYGAPSKIMSSQGLRFKVSYTSHQAEAYRLTPLLKPRYARIKSVAIEAIQNASGCRVNPARVQGDPAKVVAELVC